MRSFRPLALVTSLLSLVGLLAACGPAGQDNAGGSLLEVSPPQATLAVNEATAFAALSSTSLGVTWSVQEGTSGGSISDSGLYQAPGTQGTYHVVATSVADPGVTARATVSVTVPAGGGGGGGGGGGAAPSPMTLISRSVPATSSSGTASWGQDTSYGGLQWGFHTADIGGTGWLAYDLSGVPAAQRQKILVALYMGQGDQYYTLNFRNAMPGDTAEKVPLAYVLEGATSSSGPWTALVTVNPNANQFKSHVLNFGGYTFLRFRSTQGAPDGGQLKMDVYDASGGVTDGIVFYGDSITANVFSGASAGMPPEWFSKPINAAAPANFPFILGGGYPFMNAADAVDLIVNGSGGYAGGLPAPLRTIFSGAKYAALVYGANDAPSPDAVAAFRSRYTTIINALRAQGQTVVVAAPTWATATDRQSGLRQIRGAIGFQLPGWRAGSYNAGDYVWNGGRAYRCATGGNSVSGPTGTGSSIADGGSARWAYTASLREDFASDPNVIGGPDLYSVFENHSEWLGDGLHPNGPGSTQWRNAWVNWAKTALYGR